MKKIILAAIVVASLASCSIFKKVIKPECLELSNLSTGLVTQGSKLLDSGFNLIKNGKVQEGTAVILQGVDLYEQAYNFVDDFIKCEFGTSEKAAKLHEQNQIQREEIDAMYKGLTGKDYPHEKQ